MKYILFFITLLSFALSTSKARADFDKVCDDLYRLSCAPGEYNDGTGKAAISNQFDFESKKYEVFSAAIKKSKEDFKKMLSDQQNSYFRKTVLSATGLTLNPECNKAEESPSTKCLDLMAEGANNILTKLQFGNSIRASYMADGSMPDVMYLVESKEFKQIRESSAKDVRAAIGADSLEKNIKTKVFPQVRSLIISKIESLVKDPAQRKILIDKVSSIRFDGTDCEKNYGGKDTFVGIMAQNAMYNPAANTFVYCVGLNTQNTSEFQIAHIIAHELTHSIDPCGITLGPSDYSYKYKHTETRQEAESEYPFSNVVECLRSEKSVKAVSALDSVPSYPTSGPTTYPGGASQPSGMYNSPQAKPTFAGFCNSDQITESMADWMAAEVTPDYINKNFPKLTEQQKRFGYSNVFRSLCSDNETMAQNSYGHQPFDPHPKLNERINKIILANPAVRSQMNCPPLAQDKRYCSMSSSESKTTSSTSVTPPANENGSVR